MAKSLISNRAPGQICKAQTTEQPGSGVKVTIKDVDNPHQSYGMITNSFYIEESDNASVIPTIGKNVFVYSTGEAPVQITLKGVIGYTGTEAQDIGKFPLFYSTHSVSHKKSLLQIQIDGVTYKGVFMGYSRNRASTNGEVDAYTIQILAVRQS